MPSLVFRTWSQLYFSEYICRGLQVSADQHLLLEAKFPVCIDFQDFPSGTHLEAIICTCHSVSRCIWVGQQHFMPLEQLGGTKMNVFCFPLCHIKLPKSILTWNPFSFSYGLCLFGWGKKLALSTFQVKRKFVLPWHQSTRLRKLLGQHSYICLKCFLFQEVSLLKGLPVIL